MKRTVTYSRLMSGNPHGNICRDSLSEVGDESHGIPVPVRRPVMDILKALESSLASAGFDPKEYRDRYEENLRALIDTKIQEQPVAPGVPVLVRRPVVDILEARPY